VLGEVVVWQTVLRAHGHRHHDEGRDDHRADHTDEANQPRGLVEHVGGSHECSARPIRAQGALNATTHNFAVLPLWND
jgi:hypothetical protein